jgi:hypothetical protein
MRIDRRPKDGVDLVASNQDAASALYRIFAAKLSSGYKYRQLVFMICSHPCIFRSSD